MRNSACASRSFGESCSANKANNEAGGEFGSGFIAANLNGKISAREAVQRGRIVNLTWGPEEHRVTERHEARDIDRVRAVMMAEGAEVAEEPAV